ncbi:Phage terminase small subunit [Staphylococcus aureus]|nr:Phage terminase small subunit [Staphylococcus aureus]
MGSSIIHREPVKAGTRAAQIIFHERGFSYEINKKQLKEYIEDYKKSDDMLINLYLETYEFYCRLRDELKNSDLMMEHTNKAGASNIVKNPLSIELTKTVQTLNNLLKSMGLTAAQRKKIVQEEGGFGDY